MSTETDEDVKAEPTFTRAQMAKIVNAQVKEKVAAALAEYGDLDDLKSRASEADRSKSQLDRIEEKLAATEKRAAQAERSALVREVADELGISLRLAGKLSGSTKAELLTDGRDTMEDLGLKPNPKSGKSTSRAAEGETADNDVPEDEAGEVEIEEVDEAPAPRTAPRRGTRPRETLRSGSPHTPGTPEETDPMKLAALVTRRG
jgi:hypothetical protein